MPATVKSAVIGGTGVYSFDGESCIEEIATDYGTVEVELVTPNSLPTVAFLCRHGNQHQVPPHKINYRANIQALKHLGVEQIFATNAVGGIYPNAGPGMLVVPDQLIDYTFGRVHTYFDDFSTSLKHIDFTEPYSRRLREKLISAIGALGHDFEREGVYGCVQGPRLETAAEVKRYQQDGCTILGMTGMPEAALARELDMEYAALCFSVNWAASIEGDTISMEEIYRHIEQSREKLMTVLLHSLKG